MFVLGPKVVMFLVNPLAAVSEEMSVAMSVPPLIVTVPVRPRLLAGLFEPEIITVPVPDLVNPAASEITAAMVPL